MVETRLIASRPIAASTMEYSFERPSDLTWRAGQFAYLVLPGIEAVPGDDRPFTLASVPSDDVVTIATRLGTSPFKRALAAMRPGDPVLIDGPMGGFTMGGEDREVVWLAGGMGITPFRSMVREILAEATRPTRVVLVYSTHTTEEAAYLAELRQAAARESWLTLVVALTRQPAGESAPDIEHGHIDAALLRRHVPSFDGQSWFIAGGTGMVLDLERMLLSEGVPRGRIRVDPFVV